MPEQLPGVDRAAADLAAIVAAHGWEAVLDPATVRQVLAGGAVLAAGGPAAIEAVAALTTMDGATHTLASATDPVGAAATVSARLAGERAVPPELASWATAVVLDVVQPGWGVHVASLPRSARRGGASRFVFPAVIAVVVVAAIAVALVFLLNRGGNDSASTSQAAPTTADPGPTGQGGDLTVSGTATPGAPAPALSGPDLASGKRYSLAEMTGKPTLVVFWAHWCPHCQKEMPVVQQVADEQAGSFNFLTVTTAIGQQPAAPRFSTPERLMATDSITMPVLRDGRNEAAVAYDVKGFPAFYMVDAAGKLVGTASGEMTAEELVAFMQNPTFR